MAQVIIGVDPHKRSATIEIINAREKTLGQGRFGTDRDGYQAMLAAGRKHKDRLWAVEGCNGIGRHIAQRLVADGETVVDVPAKLSARARVFATGQGRKTDPVDARSVAVVALRTEGLRQVVTDDTTVAIRLLVDRRDQLGRARTEVVSRLHHLLLELVPGGAKKDLSAPQAPPLDTEGCQKRTPSGSPRWMVGRCTTLPITPATDPAHSALRQVPAKVQRHRPLKVTGVVAGGPGFGQLFSRHPASCTASTRAPRLMRQGCCGSLVRQSSSACCWCPHRPGGGFTTCQRRGNAGRQLGVPSASSPQDAHGRQGSGARCREAFPLLGPRPPRLSGWAG
ncbi:MAG TPA: transposase [Micromonosporaceae bacterium]|nr:transposase [Micromonosporaceae bacterium]